MADRDDDTPGQRPATKRRTWIASDTVRANMGAEHRRAETASGDSQRSRQLAPMRRSAVQAIPEPIGIPDSGEFEQATEDITAPIAMLDEEPNEEDREAVRRSKRDSGSPVHAEDFAKLVRHVNKHILQLKAEERSANTQNANHLLELLNRPPDERTRKLEDRIKTLEGRSRLLSWVLVAVFGTGGGSVLALAQRIWDRAEREGELTVRVQHLTEEVARLRDHQYSPAAERPSWPQPPTKEAPP